ncbi:hypothetical protein AKJ47_01500, partial [candidate division MSBL1 archaeon SCGC-AAA261G05]
EVYSTPEVISEIVAGVELGYKDALLVKKLADEEKIRQVKVEKDLEEYEELLKLHRGEISTLLAARELGLKHVIVDDKRAIKAAKYLGLKPRSTPFILLEALRKKKLSGVEFKSAMERLVDAGYRISPKLYTRILQKAEDIQK